MPIDNVKLQYQLPYLTWLDKKELTEELSWGSHQPVVMKLFDIITTGNVIEFGMGNYSTPLLHGLCNNQERKILSIENNRKWYRTMLKHKTKNHPMFLFTEGNIKDKNYKFFNIHFSIAFIDAHPGEIRQVFINNMKDKVDYFIVHDSEDWVNGNKNNPYNWDFSGFRHVLHFKEVHPMTTILSNLKKIDKGILNIVEYEKV